jgi:hypothetical protein
MSSKGKTKTTRAKDKVPSKAKVPSKSKVSKAKAKIPSKAKVSKAKAKIPSKAKVPSKSKVSKAKAKIPSKAKVSKAKTKGKSKVPSKNKTVNLIPNDYVYILKATDYKEYKGENVTIIGVYTTLAGAKEVGNNDALGGEYGSTLYDETNPDVDISIEKIRLNEFPNILIEYPKFKYVNAPDPK